MGIRIVVSNADYSDNVDVDAQAYLDASGIVDEKITSGLNIFVRGLKANNLWGKLDYIYPFLGTSYDQIKYNLKNLSDEVLKDVETDGAILNTIDKGLVFDKSEGYNKKRVLLPIHGSYLSNLPNGGNVIYFANKAPSPSFSEQYLSNNLNSTQNHFYFGPRTINNAKTLVIYNKIFNIAPRNMDAGAFSASFDNIEAKFFGKNGQSLGIASATSASGANPAAKVTIGAEGASYSIVDNTVSYVAFGAKKLTDLEMKAHTELVNELIEKVHGIIV